MCRKNIKKVVAAVLVCVMTASSVVNLASVKVYAAQNNTLTSSTKGKKFDTSKKNTNNTKKQSSTTSEDTGKSTQSVTDAANNSIYKKLKTKGIFCEKSMVVFQFPEAFDKGDSKSEIGQDRYIIYLDYGNSYIDLEILSPKYKDVPKNAKEYLSRYEFPGSSAPCKFGNGYCIDLGIMSAGKTGDSYATNIKKYGQSYETRYAVDLTNDKSDNEYLVARYVRRIEPGNNNKSDTDVYMILGLITTRLFSESNDKLRPAFGNMMELTLSASLSESSDFNSKWYKTYAIYKGVNDTNKGYNITIDWYDDGTLRFLMDGNEWSYSAGSKNVKPDKDGITTYDCYDSKDIKIKYNSKRDEIEIVDKSSHPEYNGKYRPNYHAVK